ncbi:MULTISPECIES: serine/threonine-protein kinase [unclassified Knoellia]|uniref:serine/threonine-protein kinase n=1 Tax=Knoellia altitudinis TaxID=3404795 RepID=UPI0036148F9D
MEPQVIAGRYEVVRAVGQGGMGTVWLCLDLTLEREVAVKRIGALPGDSAAALRAMREARIAASLNHPNAVAVYDIIDQDEAHWLVMEYVDGASLSELVRDEGPLSPTRAAEIGAAIARVLDRAHDRGIVHRDIKPSNILVHRSGTPKLSDFGIARSGADAQLTLTGQMTGTPGFLSPELARGEDPTPASDTWALGATLFHAVEGRAPFEERDNPLAVLQDVLAGRMRPLVAAGPLGRAIEAMMEPDPARRWTMAEAAAELDDIAAGRVPTSVLPAAMAPVDRPTSGLDELDDFLGAQSGADTRSDGAWAAGVGATAPALGGADGEREDGSGQRADRRRSRWPLVLLLAILLGGGAYALANRDGVDEPDSAQGTRTSSAPQTTPPTSSTPPPSSTPSSTPQGTTSSSPTRTPSRTPSSPTRTPTPTPTRSPSPTAASSDAALGAFVRDYYAGVTDSARRDDTFAQLTPAMQREAGGRQGYEGFWRTIESVSVTALDPDAEARTVDMRLTFRPRSGGPITESHRWTVERDGGRWLVGSDDAVG